MFRRATRFIAAIVFLLIQAEPTAARSFTVEDLLRTENIGRIIFDPHDRWLVFERLEPFLAMSRFDMLSRANVLRARLYIVDLEAPWRAKPLLDDPRPGMIAYDVSPDGNHLAIGRLVDGRWRLGIVATGSGMIRWLDLAPDYDPFRTTLRWVSDDRLVAIVDPGGARPWWLRAGGFPAEFLPGRWHATRSGMTAAVTTVGSGRFRDKGSSTPKNALVLIHARSGQVSTLAKGHFLSLEVSPDLRHIALTERGAAVSLPQTRMVSQIDGSFQQRPVFYDLQRSELWRPCADCDQLGRPEWSPDSGHVAMFARRAGEDWPDARIFDINVRERAVLRTDAGDVVPFVEEFPDGTAHAAFRWHGSALLLLGRSASAPGERGDWYALREGQATSLTSRLPNVGSEISKVGDCAAAMGASDGLWCLDGAVPKRLYGANVQASRGAAVGWTDGTDHITLNGSILPGREIPIADGERVDGVEASATGRILAIRRAGANGMISLALMSQDRFRTIAKANVHLRDVQPAIVRPLSYSLPGGRTVTSWLYLPPAAREHRKFAMVAIPYPGRSYGAAAPADQEPGAGRFHTSAQLLAGRGYAVLLPSLPEDRSAPERVTNLVDGLDRAVDAAITTGAIDPQRVTLWGHSFGAYAVAMIATRTCRYASAIASAGVYDLAAVGGTFGMTTSLAPERNLTIGQNFAWAESGQAGLGVPPWIDPRRYVDASPVYHLGQIAMPMLIVAADHDISPLGQAQQLFSGLSRQNKDAELVTYWGEGHVIGSPANMRDFYNRVFNWLGTTLPLPRPASNCPSGSLAADASKRVPIAP